MELYFVLFNWRYNRTWKKYFNSEVEMDKFKRKLKYVIDVSIIEDSREIFYPDYN